MKEEVPEIINQEMVTVPIGSVKPHPANPNKGDVGVIRGSINANGFYGGLVVQKSRKRILVGEHRWRAMKAAGAKEIPVIFVEVDDATALDIVVVDNRSAELAERDLLALTKVLEKTLKRRDVDMRATGYTERAATRLVGLVKAYNPNAEAPRSSEEDFWPILHMKMPPALHERVTKWLARMQEEDEPAWRALERIVDRIDRTTE